MSNKTPYQIWLPVLLSFFLVGGMILGYNLQQTRTETMPSTLRPPSDSKALGMGQVEEVLRYVDSRYVDGVNREDLVEKAIDKLLEELDPHSNYIPKEQLNQVNENLEGSFVGIGVEFDMYKDTILVLRVVAGGPSHQAGLQAGDRILMVEDSLVAGQDLGTDEIVSQLRGQKGSKVRLSVLRRGQAQPLELEVERGEIPILSIDAALMLDHKTGYIKINRFSSTTYTEFMEALDELQPQGMKDLVIDLRQNPGGYLKEATRILNQIIEERGVMLVYTEGKNSSRKEYTTKGAVKYQLDDIAVLIDEGSASASEIMAGALQDVDRALVVGRRSFGKGLVQEQYELTGGAALRLTIARYYTQSGRLIQKAYANGREAYKEKATQGMAHSELANEVQAELPDSTEYHTRNGRVVYSGGGIMPDVFVPMDSLQTQKDFIVAANQSLFFVYDYMDAEKKAFRDKNPKDFAQNFQVEDRVYQQFLDYCLRQEPELNRDKLQAFKTQLKERLHAQLARHLYGNEGLHLVQTKTDKMVLEALSVLDDSKALLQKGR